VKDDPTASGPALKLAAKAAAALGELWRCWRTERLLRRWDRLRRMPHPLAMLLYGGEGSGPAGRVPAMFEPAIRLVVDVEKFLLRLDDRERYAVLGVALGGRTEGDLGRAAGVGRKAVSEWYWSGILNLDRVLDEEGYFAEGS
jgi:DNA-directed RNA polymerase specialized sigma24 family protein